ncbi:MAG: DNA mismatch repair protein MutS [Deltaproteobacteria bacterium]|nr:DNA mismatch repair protein MutS [Deltaproteobacteria bacterium]
MSRQTTLGLTPALKQWLAIKEAHPETILFFQVGDFYELFFEDATLAAPLLELTLTSRQKLEGAPVPLCGVPLSAGETYIARLVQMGHKVAVCDQIGPTPTKGLAERVVSRVVTPATILPPDGENRARYLVALNHEPSAKAFALAALEVSTGDFILGQWPSAEDLWSELTALEPAELIIPQSASPELQSLAEALGVFQTIWPDAAFVPSASLANWRRVFGEDFQPDPVDSPLVLAVGSVALGYALSLSPKADSGTGSGTDSRSDLSYLAPPRRLWANPYLGLDEAAIRNLELTRSLKDNSPNHTVLKLISRHVTPMGGRLLKDWLLKPLRNRSQVSARHEAVASLVADGLKREKLLELLKRALDLERALSRLTLGRGSVRDLVAVRTTLSQAAPIKELLLDNPAPLLRELAQNLETCPQILARLEASLVDSPLIPGASQIVRPGLSPKLDELRDLESGGKKRVAAIEAQERGRTGINNLKVGFNKVFGYYLEVTKSNLTSVPPEWIRKQTIAGGERYVTAELKEWEEKIVTAGEKRQTLENRILERLKSLVARQAPQIKQLAANLAAIDALAALAVTALERSWVRPELTDDDILDIKGGRHPVVEAALPPGETFVANDTLLNPWERLLIITGPNMAGKSTILRQTALIVILNQMGSFVPAEKALLSMRDQVFTRVGASDDLARGQSTFMVEMSETARILRKASPRSLVILDEVGRGTSTFDGLAIAWAVAESLHDLGQRGVPTLFATHYHELVDLARTKPLTRNYNVAVKKLGQGIIFLRRLTPGGASRSYGLVVAALAGLPDRVIRRAGEVLADLTRQKRLLVRPAQAPRDLLAEAGLKDDPPQALVREISQLKLEEFTPLEAFNLLTELKARAQEMTL